MTLDSGLTDGGGVLVLGQQVGQGEILSEICKQFQTRSEQFLQLRSYPGIYFLDVDVMPNVTANESHEVAVAGSDSGPLRSIDRGGPHDLISIDHQGEMAIAVAGVQGVTIGLVTKHVPVGDGDIAFTESEHDELHLPVSRGANAGSQCSHLWSPRRQVHLLVSAVNRLSSDVKYLLMPTQSINHLRKGGLRGVVHHQGRGDCRLGFVHAGLKIAAQFVEHFGRRSSGESLRICVDLERDPTRLEFTKCFVDLGLRNSRRLRQGVGSLAVGAQQAGVCSRLVTGEAQRLKCRGKRIGRRHVFRLPLSRLRRRSRVTLIEMKSSGAVPIWKRERGGQSG